MLYLNKILEYSCIQPRLFGFILLYKCIKQTVDTELTDHVANVTRLCCVPHKFYKQFPKKHLHFNLDTM